MKVYRYILAASTLFGCNDKEAMYVDTFSQCNNGIENIYYYQRNISDNDKYEYLSHVICDYDESGRVVHEKHYSYVEPENEIKSETIYDWQENRIVIETRHYYLDQSNRRIVNLQ